MWGYVFIGAAAFGLLISGFAFASLGYDGEPLASSRFRRLLLAAPIVALVIAGQVSTKGALYPTAFMALGVESVALFGWLGLNPYALAWLVGPFLLVISVVLVAGALGFLVGFSIAFAAVPAPTVTQRNALSVLLCGEAALFLLGFALAARINSEPTTHGKLVVEAHYWTFPILLFSMAIVTRAMFPASSRSP